MKSQLKHYKEFDKKLRQEVNNSNDDENNFIIELYLENYEIIYNKFSSIQKSRINNELITYLENEIKYKPVDEPITVEIDIKTHDEKFIESLEKLIKKSTINNIEDITHDLKRNLRISILLLIFGLITLGCISLFSYFTDHYVFNEFFVIVSWVLIWQFVEMYFFDRPKLKYDKMKLLQLYFAEFRYK
ncbi:MAG: hypothetical protein LBP67_08500 [Bacteroidales bacterium]|jgi:hypothetical protein|nr:hypothetical protein [Bacteroidales bacterium]